MKILLTGNKGFVGSHIENALTADGHEVVGLEVHPTFREWYDEMRLVVTDDIEAVIHAGAMPYNQSKDPMLFLWNAHASYLLAKAVNVNISTRIPFIYFSTFLVSSYQDTWDWHTPYAWSKVCGEIYVQQWMPNATILRPAVQWGDESRKPLETTSIPYQLATHQLENLFRHWGRSYVHILDVCEAIKVCVRDKPKGAFELHTEYMDNQHLSKLVQWQGYEWIENPEVLGYIATEHRETNVEPILPNWFPNIFLVEELPIMERSL